MRKSMKPISGTILVPRTARALNNFTCIKQLKINKWEFLQPFPVFQRIFLHVIMDKSVEGGLKSIRNTMTVGKNPQENREQWQKFPLNLNLLYATGPRAGTKNGENSK